MTRAAAEVMRARYDLGRLVHSLRYNSKDGNARKMINSLAQALYMKPGTLRRYARVSEFVGSEEFDDYVKPRGRDGSQLTWSHMEELAEARRIEVRRTCVKQTIAEGLSVSELRARVRVVMKS